MLYNKQGQIVSIPKNANTHNAPNIQWKDLREVVKPSEKTHAKMFRLEERAKVK